MTSKIYIGTSLDGFIARPNGDLDWLTPFASAEAFESYDSFMSGIDAIVIGRGTFEKVLEFPAWPYQKKVFVLSNSLKELPDSVKDRATLLSMNPVDLIRHLSSLSISSIYVDGGKLIQGFLQEDLIDELIISKAPVLIGKGIPLFGSLDIDLSFQHIKTTVQANGLVRSYYKKIRR